MSRSRGTALKGTAVGLGAVALAAVAIVVTRVSLDDAGDAQSAGPIPSLPSGATAITSGRTQADLDAARTESGGTGAELGVFEEIRGWIVYPIDGRLEAVNPAGPAERHTLELPAGMDVLLGSGPDGATAPMPAGWSADGTKLALSSEYFGDFYVLSADGSYAREALGPGGCCLFVTEPWLSPDGTTGLGGVDPTRIGYVDLATDHSFHLGLEPPLAADRSVGNRAAWSADGSRIAFLTVADPRAGAEPTLHVVDFSTGANEVLERLDVGHVRHVVWSPDDSQLLVVAGAPLQDRPLNPLVHPQATSLYLVATDGSGVREIASGYYVATAWSPEGTQIAAIEYSPSGRRLVVMNADGTGSRVLVELPPGELFTGVAWHPLPDDD